jgi:hypothetical protein
MRSRPPSFPAAPPRRVLPVARVVSVLVVLLAALGAGPARGDAPATPEPPQPPPTPPPAGAERVELHLRFEPWVLTGRFRVVSASGTFADEGVARDDAGFSAQRPIERVLEGARGTLVLRVAAGPKTPGFPPMFGRWTVVRGTGAYAALAGAGTFTTCGGDAQKGSPFEVQTLVGYLHPR